MVSYTEPTFYTSCKCLSSHSYMQAVNKKRRDTQTGKEIIFTYIWLRQREELSRRISSSYNHS